ncbi:MAG: DUF4446 family protein [Clostridia bacterium]|nr:DUF4446 family protein [Clostridia bacterium]
MEDLFLNTSPEIVIGFGICLFFNLMLLIANISNARKINKLKSKYNNFMSGSSDKNIEQLLELCLDKVSNVSIKNRELESQINDIKRNLINCIQKIGVVRYNAFDNVGSDLSFSIAMLDNKDDGVVFSGIYSRDSSSTYAKPIFGGKSKYTLSAEEIQALDYARKNSREKLINEK